MSEILFHNVVLRGVSILLIPGLILLVQMVRNRKPGTSFVAAVFLQESLTDRGLRAKKWWDIVSTIALVWIAVGLIVGAVLSSGLVG